MSHRRKLGQRGDLKPYSCLGPKTSLELCFFRPLPTSPVLYHLTVEFYLWHENKAEYFL